MIVKVIGPRLLHSSQGIIDPLDTPDGGNVLHKHMAIVKITTHYSPEPLLTCLSEGHLRYISECKSTYMARTKVFINGSWVAYTNPIGMSERSNFYVD